MYFSNLLNDQVRKAQKGNTAAYKCKRKIARYGRKENKELGLQINSCSFSLWYLVRNLDITSIFPYLRWYRSTHVKWCSAGAYEIGCPFRHHPWFTGNRRRTFQLKDSLPYQLHHCHYKSTFYSVCRLNQLPCFSMQNWDIWEGSWKNIAICSASHSKWLDATVMW